MITKVISGGQTGADTGALCGTIFAFPDDDPPVSTGGWAPLGWLTEKGPQPSLKYMGLIECPSKEYPVRTEWNVRDSDFTVWMGKMHTAGFKCTERAAKKCGKQIITISKNWDFGDELLPLQALIEINGWKVMNFAGNRESSNPGIQLSAEMFVKQLLQRMYA